MITRKAESSYSFLITSALFALLHEQMIMTKCLQCAVIAIVLDRQCPLRETPCNVKAVCLSSLQIKFDLN